MRQIISAIGIVLVVVALVAVAFTYAQAQDEETSLTVDLQRRSVLLADSVASTIQSYVVSESNASQLQNIINRFAQRERLAGLIVIDNKEQPLASSSGITTNLPVSDFHETAVAAMDQDATQKTFIREPETNNRLYVIALPLHREQSVVGSLILIQNASYIDAALFDVWKTGLTRFLIYAVAITVVFGFIIYWTIARPMARFLKSLRQLRHGETGAKKESLSNHHLFKPIFTEVSKMQSRLTEAQNAASYEARLRGEKLESPWTSQRLKEYTKEALKGKHLYIISNREPYIHIKKGNSISYIRPASGMVTAIEPMVMATGGMWLAHGSGEADAQVVDKNDIVKVPPHSPSYELKRIWLTKEEQRGFYDGFANNGLWPLCHNAYVLPVFNVDDWHAYIVVNQKFANSILKEIKHIKKPIIFIQDYHFTLLPKMIKKKRPDAAILVFWHIPWPSSEAFRVCPWSKEVLDGMLGADLIGFHTQLHCNNFIETVGKELEALIDLEQFAVQREKHVSYIKPFPIGIPFTMSETTELSADERQALFNEYHIPQNSIVGVGVDRLDYTKGIIERLRAVDRFLEKYPSYREKFTFMQLAPTSRQSVESYQRFAHEVQKEVEEINAKYKTRHWKPIIFINSHKDRGDITKLYQLGDVCMVTSLHDGMNLVAKEYVGARTDKKGVLVLSEFAGASRELKDALIVNPYDIEEMADAIHTAITMPLSQQTKRMERMRKTIENNNSYRWSAEILKAMLDIQ